MNNYEHIEAVNEANENGTLACIPECVEFEQAFNFLLKYHTIEEVRADPVSYRHVQHAFETLDHRKRLEVWVHLTRHGIEKLAYSQFMHHVLGQQVLKCFGLPLKDQTSQNGQ